MNFGTFLFFGTLLIASAGQASQTVRRLIPHLGMVESPTPESGAFLRDIALNHEGEKITATAHLRLGIMRDNLRESDSVRAERLFEEAPKFGRS